MLQDAPAHPALPLRREAAREVSIEGAGSKEVWDPLEELFEADLDQPVDVLEGEVRRE